MVQAIRISRNAPNSWGKKPTGKLISIVTIQIV